jgi:Domain of unknown function (DUF1707)
MPGLGMRGYEARRRAQEDATMRVSDADRAEVADRLAQHYGDGRLDQAELDDRLGQAMSAKTRADLNGLLSDLPDTGVSKMDHRSAPPPREPRPPRPRGPRRRHDWLRVLLVIVIVVVALHLFGAVGALFWPFGWMWGWLWPGPWLLIALLVFLWLCFGRRRRYRD